MPFKEDLYAALNPIGVQRNRRRSPDDFMFQLTANEVAALTSQIAISKPDRGGCGMLPFALPEHVLEFNS